MRENANEKNSEYGRFLRSVAKHINEVSQMFSLRMNIKHINLLVFIEFLISF